MDGGCKPFRRDRWERIGSSSGFGITAVLEQGSLLEKAAINITEVEGLLSPERAKAMSARGREAVDPCGGQAYSASAMSLVFHPCSPFVPTLRADIRRFKVQENCKAAGIFTLSIPYVLCQTPDVLTGLF